MSAGEPFIAAGSGGRRSPDPAGSADADRQGATEPADRAELARLIRDEGRLVLATLVRRTGSLELAEEAVQEAVVRALETWPRDGTPRSPRAWLTTVARNCAVDLVRRESGRFRREAEAARLLEVDDGPAGPIGGEAVEDDLLRLVFTCCHPSLSTDSQIALSLRTICGLTTAEVARALLVSEATMAKRLTRVRKKIAVAGIPYRVPAPHELPDRLRGVLAVVYLMFNEGYAATAGDDHLRIALVDEAIRTARLLDDLMPGEPGVKGLLALMLLHDSRRDARLGDGGELVLLADQDRSRWDRSAIVEGVELVGDGLRRSADSPDTYVVQAAIAACHGLAPDYRSTDWAAIVSWYEVLLRIDPTPIVGLNHAAAVAELAGPDAGLALVDQVAGLERYPLWHASRAELLTRLGRRAEARESLARALELPMTGAQRGLLESRAQRT